MYLGIKRIGVFSLKKKTTTTILQANPIAKWIVVDSNRIIFRDM